MSEGLVVEAGGLTAGPNNCIAVSMRPVMNSTMRMNEPSRTTPGSSLFCEINISMRMMKITVSEPTVTP